MFDIRRKISPRLKASRAHKGWTFLEASEHLSVLVGKKVIPSRYGNWELGQNIPPLDMFLHLGKLYGLPPAYLAGLTDDDGSAPEPRNYCVPPTAPIPTPQGIIDLGDDSIAFRPAFLESIKLQRNQVLMVKAPDDSMANTIEEGDLVLIDLRETAVTRNDMFAIMVNGRLWLRWIRQTLEDDYIIQAEDSDRYPDTLVTKEKLEDLYILGRIRMVHRIR